MAILLHAGACLAGEQRLQVDVFGGIQNLYAHDSVVLAQAKHDVLSKAFVDGPLFPVIQTKVQQVCFGIVVDLHPDPPVPVEDEHGYGRDSIFACLRWQPVQCDECRTHRSDNPRPKGNVELRGEFLLQ
jgi:hypothetical protein